MALDELVIADDVGDDGRIQIDLQLFHSNCHLVLVGILILFEGVSHRELHLVREGLQQELVLHSYLLVELVLHHFVDGVGLNQLEHAVLEIERLIPNRSRNEHLAHRVPINAQISDLLQLHNCARVLLLLCFLLLGVSVKLNVLDRKPK